MTTTSNFTARFARVTWFGLLALAVALTLAWPGVADAKKHPKTKCTTAHAKGHKAKRKRCQRHGAKRTPRRSTTKTGGQTGSTSAAEAEGCRQEQAGDPDGFAETYGSDDALDTCVQRAKGSSQTNSSGEESADDD